MPTKTKAITFSRSFYTNFDKMISTIQKSLDLLNKAKTAEYDNYGLCNCTYNIRYITPENISIFVSDIVKLIGLKRIGEGCITINDYEVFTTECAKRFIVANNCTPFEKSAGTFMTTNYISSKNCKLEDLILAWENEGNPKTTVISKYEMERRTKSDGFVNDVKRLNDMHFTAIVKKMIDVIPSGIVTEGSTNSILQLSLYCIEKFIMFACTSFAMTISDMLSYIYPSASYKVNASYRDNEPFMECCLLKTNNITIHEQLPFDINLRTIVIGDATMEFKETRAALTYILNESVIGKLVNRYIDASKVDVDCSMLDRLIMPTVGDISLNDNRFPIGDCNWLDKIAYGNAFIDGNYRPDLNGNAHAHPVTNTVDALYKMYGGCDLQTNEDLAENIVRLSIIMKHIICSSSCSSAENKTLIRDILGAVGEMLTRNMLKLYSNNTKILDYTDEMEDALSPTMITESFVMEADDPSTVGADKTKKDDTPTVTAATPGQSNVSKAGQLKQKISELIAKFMNWLTTKFSAFATNFNKDHEKEFKWINGNDKLNQQISTALANRSFVVNVNKFPDFNVPAQELANVKVKEIVDKWLKDKNPLDVKAIKKELYPTGAAQVVDAKTPADEVVGLTNYILYKQITPRNPYTGSLRQKMWDELVTDLKSTSRLLESQTKSVSDSLKAACSELQTYIRKAEVIKASNNKEQSETEKADVVIGDRAAELFTIVQQVSATYYVTKLNVIRSKFYGVSYKLYRDTINIYNSEVSKKSVNTQATTTTTTTRQTNTANNADNAGMPDLQTK